MPKSDLEGLLQGLVVLKNMSYIDLFKLFRVYVAFKHLDIDLTELTDLKNILVGF